MTDLFLKLANTVEDQWTKNGQDYGSFASIATTAIETFNYDLSEDELNEYIANWFLTTPSLPEQINVHNTFGQPPVTVFNNGKFVVDLYFWLGCDTSIHSHGFRGAFKVLHGKSLHETFRVTVKDQVESDVAITSLGTPSIELLSEGDVRTILPGSELTHRVIHLEEPTVTLCVKTINEPSLSQWHHFQNGLAIKKRHLDPNLIKQVYYFQYLASQNGAAAAKFLDKFVAKPDASTLMNLCEEIAGGAYELDSGLADLLLEKIYSRFAHTDWFRLYEESAAENSEQNAKEIRLENSDAGLARLATHLVNANLTFTTTQSLLDQFAGKSVSKEEIGNLVESNIDPEHPSANLQVQRMRAFLEH